MGSAAVGRTPGRGRRMAIRFLVLLVVVLTLPLAVAHVLLRSSLPQLDGDLRVAGIAAPVTIERDALGIPTIRGASRADLAYGTGFVHGQERFFQMDLSRRLAAGELSGLFGEAAHGQDAKARIFRFRQVAGEVLAAAPPPQRAVLAAYARGVNQGLASLAGRPWEYWVLRARPVPWQEEDTVLVAHAMWWDLQYAGLQREKLRRALQARLPRLTAFLYPGVTEWDSPNRSGPLPGSERSAGGPDMPTAEEVDFRTPSRRQSGGSSPARPPAAGSNNWGVSGRLSSSGAALIASDMHLRLRVPAVWFRARLQLQSTVGDDALDLNGVTLPGAPMLVAGSNGRIAWGFTNSYGDWLDVARAPCSPRRDAPAAGALFERDPDGVHCWFAQWLAAVPEATNLNMLQLERARSVREALALAPTIGIPHQNAVIGDREGHLAWTIFGRIPAALDERRNGGGAPWIAASDHPRILDPASGRVWTANGLATDDPRQQLAIGGDEAGFGAEYDLGARARQIRDALFALERAATPADMLRIQLDDRALLLARWQRLLVSLLDEAAVQGEPRRAEMRRLVARWDARAGTDSVGYRLVRTFRATTERTVWQMVLRAAGIDASEAPPPARFEAPLWRLVSERPTHLLAAEFASWRELLLAQVDAAIAGLGSECDALARCAWGGREPARVRHPLSPALPFLSRLLDMPEVRLPGDHDMPRVQDGAFGASERFAVSPGHEAQGYLHIAGGQSGHPLSPYYRAGFREWAAGKPLPFLPGPARHALVLRPAG